MNACTKRILLTILIAPGLALAARAAAPQPGEGPSGAPPKVVHDWPEYRGPNGQFADTSKVALADSMTAMKLLWESEEKGIGYGKSHSAYYKDLSFGGDVGPGGISSPIVAGGLVIMSYFFPSGEVIHAWEKQHNKPDVWEKHKWKNKIDADDVVIGIDAATGKTRWKQVFSGAGRNGFSDKRHNFGCTPIAYQGKVYALGSCGALYCLDLATGKVLWKTPNEPDLEAAKKTTLAKGGDKPYWEERMSIPTGWLMVHDDVLIVPVKTGYSLRGGNTRGVSLADGKTLWEVPGHPGLLAYATIESRKCLVNAGICIEARTGKVLWQQKPEQVYNGPPVMAGNILVSYAPHPKSDPPGLTGILAGFQIDLKGAKRIWTLDERFHREMLYDAGGFRNIAARDDLLYHVVHSSDAPGKKNPNGSFGSIVAQVIRPADGKILASQPAEGMYLPFLWGDRLVLVGDISHRPRGANPEYWQLFTTDPADFKALGERWLATDKHQGTGGYELQVYDPFADGLVFMRVFGGIRCYDLRGNRAK
jgi:outer membrane protein assembly factor BamB